MGLLDKIKNRLTGASLGNEASLALVNEELSQGIKQDDIWEVADLMRSSDTCHECSESPRIIVCKNCLYKHHLLLTSI
jgi:hypothetical protein